MKRLKTAHCKESHLYVLRLYCNRSINVSVIHSLQVLYDSVTDCLQNASKNRYKSIAFPAIGTGNLGFDKKEVAAIMADAVVDFAHSCQTEIDVMFIIYPSDDQTYKVVNCKDAFTIVE